MNAKIRQQLDAPQAPNQRRLDKNQARQSRQARCSPPATSITRSPTATAASPTAASAPCTCLARRIGLIDAIDERLHLLKIHLPYHESDHVLNIAYNALCDGTCLQDIELRRNDEVFLDALGARRIPDPTTAGDFCRRFQRRRRAHAASTSSTTSASASGPGSRRRSSTRPRIDMDGTLVETTGECKPAWTSPTTAPGAIIRWSCRWPTPARC